MADGSPTRPAIERKLTTILAADVAGYSRLMAEDEEQTLRTFRDYRSIFDALIASHGGRVFNTAGDAILAEFGSAVEAVRCATDVQAALQTRNEQLPPQRQLKFRIGVNLGDVMVQGADLLGDSVNIAARLQTMAEPGGVCISGSVHDQIRNKLSLSFKALGEQTYKNIAQPVRTFSIVEPDANAALHSRKIASWVIGRCARPAAAAVAIVLLIGAAYWGYAEYQRREALRPTIVAVEPPIGLLPEGARVLVNDGTCPHGQIKEVIGGNRAKNIPRERRCIPR